MQIKATVDMRQMDAKIAEMRRSRSSALAAAAAASGAEMTRDLINLTRDHRDTNRLIRSFEDAHNDLARLSNGAVSPVTKHGLNRSSRWMEFRERLEIAVSRAEAQERRIARYIEANEKKPGFKASWPSHRKLIRAYDKAGDVTDRAIAALDEYDRSGGAGSRGIVVYGQSRRRKNRTLVGTTTRNLDRVVIQEFGGKGTITTIGPNTIAVGASYEPHAKIANRRLRLLAQAQARQRTVGRRTFTAGYFNHIAKKLGPGTVSAQELAGLSGAA